ncbi:MAG: DNA/RNA non-specific endonuclease [Firmicutes bacterium]|nr:DNA/RNA non-specific endonuclease [Bacillota bacterium]
MKRSLSILLALLLCCFLLTACENEFTDYLFGDKPNTDPNADTVFTIIGPEQVPDYQGSPYVAINGNIPFFEDEELTTVSFEDYAPLDELGRCGEAYACLGKDLMPTGERGSISAIHPSGWQSSFYDFVDGGSLYNRCHLIAWKLAAEDDNERNLITGTRYLNATGMLPFEDMVAAYIRETRNHVLYRVTPIFHGDELIARGVLMEAESVEDGGDGIFFCVYCYNVQPGVGIDYTDGDNWLLPAASELNSAGEVTYVLNTNSGKFHYASCEGAQSMNPANKKEYTGSREELISMGYEPCSQCNP